MDGKVSGINETMYKPNHILFICVIQQMFGWSQKITHFEEAGLVSETDMFES